MNDATIPDYGPQSPSDNAFAGRMRFHQSWYRATVLEVPYGTGPTPRAKTEYGNMLTAEDAAKGLNFLTPAIFAAVKARLAETEGLIEEFRLLRNMLSSQPLCFNLFGYLGLHLDLATRLMEALFPGEVKRVTRVVVEHAPAPRAEYLNDRTAFDAFEERQEITMMTTVPHFGGLRLWGTAAPCSGNRIAPWREGR
jgi:hypothetical protein